ncbi:hypothetical protein RJ45_16990 [Photobacterium gaetbulicola]|uniref:Sulfatase N-terminal domain-containing protein n=2 Tax=Photobacterium gaetbulicola TaxID=1295392 RepID=A0A0B9H0Z3_9GAMM|nr:hypothetical protein RJ45_16990 [Photobacterium gaetbulicola]
MSVLDEKGVSDNTIVLFLSDNGIAAPFAKSNVYRNSNHTPFLVRWPNKVDASVDDEHFISMVAGSSRWRQCKTQTGCIFSTLGLLGAGFTKHRQTTASH